MSDFSPATVKYLRQELAQLNSWRTNEEIALAGVETKVRTIKTTVSKLTGRIADLEKLLAIVEPEPDPAREFIIGDLVNISEPTHPHWGRRAKVTDVGAGDDDPIGIEWDNLGNCLYVAPAHLMHHTEFVKQPQEYFDAAETVERPVPFEWAEDGNESESAQEAWIAQGERAVDEVLDARDAESGS